MKSHKAFIVIPTFNERETIVALFQQLHQVTQDIPSWDFSFLVVDDSSPDQTAIVVRELQSKYRNLHLLLGDKKGLGDAYRRGFQYVLDHFDVDYIFQMDADLQHDPKDIPQFVQKAEEGHGFIIGSRYLHHSRNRKWERKRWFFSKVANFMARYVAGIRKIKDCTSGFRCIAASFLRSFDLRKLDSDGYAFQMSLLHMAQKKKILMTEIPITFMTRKKGSSKLGFSDISDFFLHSIRLRFKRY